MLSIKKNNIILSYVDVRGDCFETNPIGNHVVVESVTNRITIIRSLCTSWQFFLGFSVSEKQTKQTKCLFAWNIGTRVVLWGQQLWGIHVSWRWKHLISLIFGSFPFEAHLVIELAWGPWQIGSHWFSTSPLLVISATCVNSVNRLILRHVLCYIDDQQPRR